MEGLDNLLSLPNHIGEWLGFQYIFDQKLKPMGITRDKEGMRE
jgi:hypothetical protein